MKLGVAGLGSAGRAVIRDLSLAQGFALSAVADVRRDAPATLEIVLAILQSSREKREIELKRQD